MNKMIAALYEDLGKAQQAVRDLTHSDFKSSQINLITPTADRCSGNQHQEQDARRDDGTVTKLETIIAGLIGSGMGLIIGLGLRALSELAPNLTTISIETLSAGAAVVGGLLGTWKKQMHGSSATVDQGGTLVTIKLTEADTDRAIWVLQQHYPERLVHWSRQD